MSTKQKFLQEWWEVNLVHENERPKTWEEYEAILSNPEVHNQIVEAFDEDEQKQIESLPDTAKNLFILIDSVVQELKTKWLVKDVNIIKYFKKKILANIYVRNETAFTRRNEFPDKCLRFHNVPMSNWLYFPFAVYVYNSNDKNKLSEEWENILLDVFSKYNKWNIKYYKNWKFGNKNDREELFISDIIIPGVSFQIKKYSYEPKKACILYSNEFIDSLEIKKSKLK